jgi:hypothetical protein
VEEGGGALSIKTAGSKISCKVEMYKRQFFCYKIQNKGKILSNNFTTQKFISETPFKKMKFL